LGASNRIGAEWFACERLRGESAERAPVGVHDLEVAEAELADRHLDLLEIADDDHVSAAGWIVAAAFLRLSRVSAPIRVTRCCG